LIEDELDDNVSWQPSARSKVSERQV
jgi:hypothetical protein